MPCRTEQCSATIASCPPRFSVFCVCTAAPSVQHLCSVCHQPPAAGRMFVICLLGGQSHCQGQQQHQLHTAATPKQPGALCASSDLSVVHRLEIFSLCSNHCSNDSRWLDCRIARSHRTRAGGMLCVWFCSSDISTLDSVGGFRHGIPLMEASRSGGLNANLAARRLHAEASQQVTAEMRTQ